MLRVKTYLDKSPIHGIGVFAAENVVAGSLVWTFYPNIDRILDINEKTLRHQFFLDQEFIIKYAFLDKQTGLFILSADNDRFTNHSDHPNTKPDDLGNMLAVRDIIKGEEITANYYEIDKYADDKLHLKMF